MKYFDVVKRPCKFCAVYNQEMEGTRCSHQEECSEENSSPCFPRSLKLREMLKKDARHLEKSL